MTLSDQVISLPLAKRLKELGVKQESLWWWRDGAGVQIRCNLYPAQIDTQDVYQAYAAFTVAELGEMLPSFVYAGLPHWDKPHRLWLDISLAGEGMPHRIGYNSKEWDGGGGSVMNHHEDAATEAEARGLMLAYLIENHLITV